MNHEIEEVVLRRVLGLQRGIFTRGKAITTGIFSRKIPHFQYENFLNFLTDLSTGFLVAIILISETGVYSRVLTSVQ